MQIAFLILFCVFANFGFGRLISFMVFGISLGVTGRSSSKSYSVKDETSNEIMAVIKLDNVTVAQTNWRPCSQQAWDQRFSIDLDKSREVEIDIYWRDWRSLCGVKFLRLEEFIDDVRHGMALQLEPQGLLFAEIKFLNPMISRKPKLQRQRRIFKQQGDILLAVFCIVYRFPPPPQFLPPSYLLAGAKREH